MESEYGGKEVSRGLIGLCVWVPLFLAFELPAHFKLVPWPTLSRTIWDGIKWWHPLAYFVALFVFVLLGHLDMHWSVKWLILVALVIAAAILAHVATR